jgi:hypothetical protein
MKKFLKSILVVFSLATLVSCNEDDSKFSVDPQSGWAQFTSAAQINVAFGTTDEVVIPVKLFSAVNPGVDVMYTIEDVVGTSADYLTSNPGMMTIASGTLNGDLVLGLATEGLTSTIEFDVILTATSRDNVQVGLSDDSKPIVRRVRICPFTFTASYTGVPTANLATPAVGPAFSVNFTPTANPNQFTLTTCWGPNYVAFLTGNPAFNGAFPYPGTLTVDITTGLVTVTGGAAYATGGTGSMSACSGVITVTLNQTLFGSPFTTTVVFTPNAI